MSRRDATGHLNPKIEADFLRQREEEHASDDENRAFLGGKLRAHDDLAEVLGEETVAAMTSGEGQGEEVADQVVEEESGGPFVETSGSQEFAEGTDASNPETAEREPFPKA